MGAPNASTEGTVQCDLDKARIIQIDLPVQGLAREVEATEITLPMRIDVGTKGVIDAHRAQQYRAALDRKSVV